MIKNASESFKLLNPHLVTPKASGARYRAESARVRGVMNKTESEFALLLEAKKRTGEIVRYEFEGITLRWADMRYTPDFVCVFPNVLGVTLPLLLIEVKGAHIWSRDIVRFKGARAYWAEFTFEMHQKTKSGWKRKY